MNLTPDFERDLTAYMRRKGISQKSEAIREALREALEVVKREQKKYDWGKLVGIAKQWPENPDARYLTEDDLWAKGDFNLKIQERKARDHK